MLPNLACARGEFVKKTARIPRERAVSRPGPSPHRAAVILQDDAAARDEEKYRGDALRLTTYARLG